MSYLEPQQGRINTVLCLQGGGAATAWQAGAIIPLIEHPAINFTAITGTSGGALNGAILKDAFARHGQGLEGKAVAVSKLYNAWEGHIAMDNISAQCVAVHQMVNPIGHALMVSANRGLFTRKLEETLFSVLPDDETLESPKGPAFFVQTVNEETNQGRLYTGQEITRSRILASAALKDCFHPVDGEIDGAYLGGANPPSASKAFLDKADAVIYIMTNAEPDSIAPKKQQELTATDLDSSGLIQEQAYCEVELLRRHGYPVTVIAPKRSFTKAEKGQTGLATIQRRMRNGYPHGDKALKDILRKNSPVKVPA